MNWRMSFSSAPVGMGAATQPPSLKAISVSSANAWIAACCSGVSPPWSSPIRSGSTRRSSRSSEWSPVTWASAGSSAGRSATSSAARSSSSVAVIGWIGRARAMMRVPQDRRRLSTVQRRS